MKVLVIGSESIVEEMAACLPKSFLVKSTPSGADLFEDDFEPFDLVIDTTADDNVMLNVGLETFEGYIILSSVKSSLEQLVDPEMVEGKVFGMNCLPTFINREVKEMTLLNEEDLPDFKKLMEKLNWQYELVKDRVGMVTPRVVCMIINEAFYTVQEGTATKDDIDTSMKLGTAYPYGPFEWAKRIGLSKVYEVLLAVYEDTKDERYKICPLLKSDCYKSGELF
ncbi:3-hydroxyacyl-CoA dehydrogenase [bacterium]|nr:3-hydroxyacyl-CoA dehydrogenase [bacterium]